MSWVVDDSEDEDNFEASLKPQEPQVQSLSVISDFSTHDIVLPVSNQTSPISNFTTLDNGIHRPDTTTDSIVVASPSVPTASVEPAPSKPKRPKPRPAYKGHLGGSDSIEQSTSAASLIASAINQIGPDSSREPIVDATFSLDIAERAKTRRRITTGISMKSSSSSKDVGSIIVEGSSRDIIIAISSDGEAEPGTSRVDFTTQSRQQEQARSSQASSKISHIPSSNVPTLLLHSDSSSAIRTTGIPSPLFDPQRQNPGSTPPSSPFQPRKPKRRLLNDDSTFLDDGMGVNDGELKSSALSGKDREPSTKKQKRTKEKKEKKPREGKSKTAVEGDVVTATKTSTKKRAEKSKSASEQEFKSKEFVDDSDDSEEDDLLLRPSDHCKKSKTTSSSVPRTGYSDPASGDVSVQASVNESVRPSGLVSAPTTTRTVEVEPSASILPSFSVSVGPSAGVSEVPCTEAIEVSAPPSLPALPPPPIMSRMSDVDRSKPVKKCKKKRAADAHSDVTGMEGSVLHNMDFDLGVPAGRSLAGQSDVLIEEPTKKKAGRSKKKKKMEVQSSTADETRGQGTSSSSALLLPPNDPESPEQSTSTSTETQQQKKRPKSKKHGTIVSSDEDESGGNPFREKDNIDPMGVEVDKEGRSDDKENEPLPSPKNQPAQGVSTPYPSTAHHRSPVPDSKLKSRASSTTTTSHNPPRRDSMSALIRRVSSKVHSPLNSPSPSSHSHSFSHSPLAKSSRLALSRIAPLHPNRRTPPPAPPRPPPPKKSKKMLELEEKWEMELAESVDGWACLGDEERAALRRAKRDKELGFDD